MATTTTKLYQPVVFEGKEGSLSISSDGILFTEEYKEGGSKGGGQGPAQARSQDAKNTTSSNVAFDSLCTSTTHTRSISYQRRVSWQTVRKHRINDKTESQAAMRLWVEEDYGEGTEQETLVFGMQDRNQLERFNKDIQRYIKKPTTATSEEDILSNTQPSVSSASINLSPETQQQEEATPLVWLIYEHLVRESGKAGKKDLAEGPDEDILRAIGKNLQQQQQQQQDDPTVCLK